MASSLWLRSAKPFGMGLSFSTSCIELNGDLNAQSSYNTDRSRHILPHQWLSPLDLAVQRGEFSFRTYSVKERFSKAPKGFPWDVPS